MNMLNLPLTTNTFAAFLLLILICFDCSLSHNTSPTGTFIKSSKSMDGLIHNWRNRNLLHIGTSTQLISADRDSPSTSVAPEQQPKNSSQSVIQVFLSNNKSSIGTLPTPNRVRKFKLVGNGNGEYEFLDEFLASHQISEIFMVSLLSKHSSQNPNNSFDENDSSGSSSSDPSTFILSDEKIEQVSGTEKNRTAQLFNCSDISLDATDQDDIQMKNLKLKIKHQSGPGVTFTVCQIVKEDKVIQTYPTSMAVIMSVFTYNSVSLCCAWIFINSVSKFFMLYIILNVITYFPICMMLTNSITGVIIYFFPFHLNIMFILVTGWITIMSCKVVCRQLKEFRVFLIANSNVIGNVSRMFLLTMVTSIFMTLPYLLAKLLLVLCHDILGQEKCSEFIYNLTPSFVFDLILNPSFVFVSLFTLLVAYLHMLVYYIDETFTSKRKQIKNLGVQHTDHYRMYFWYYMISQNFGILGFLVIGLDSTVPQFWHLYLFVAALLQLSFLKDSLITNREKISFHVTENGKTETIRQV